MVLRSLTIRRALHDDAKGIITVHTRAIREICAKDYSEGQISSWSQYLTKESLWHQRMDRDYLWVLADEKEIMGFAHLAVMNGQLGEVMGLYLLPEIKNQGWGKKLMAIVLQEARNHGLGFLSLLSTITAKTFYESLNFYESDSPTTILINGVSIECIPMTLSMSLPPKH